MPVNRLHSMYQMLRKLQLIAYYLFRYPMLKSQLGRLGSRARLLQTKLEGAKHIHIGDKVYINSRGWLACLPLTGDANCRLSIGDGTYVGRFCHFYATSRIEIGKKVLIADKVYLSDNLHGYKNIEVPVIDQPVEQLAPVVIHDGAWLGENVCVVGASIGRNSVVGANSVVTRDIPDYCVAAGAPAIIIKRYDLEKKEWRRTDTKGNFI